MSVILMTTLFYKALILQEEIWCWSLLGLKGLMETFSFLWKTCFGYKINAFNDVDGSNGINKGMLMVLCWYLQ